MVGKVVSFNFLSCQTYVVAECSFLCQAAGKGPGQKSWSATLLDLLLALSPWLLGVSLTP